MNMTKWVTRRVRKHCFKYLYVCPANHNGAMQFEKGFCEDCGRALARLDNGKHLCGKCGWVVFGSFCGKCGCKNGNMRAATLP